MTSIRPALNPTSAHDPHSGLAGAGPFRQPRRRSALRLSTDDPRRGWRIVTALGVSAIVGYGVLVYAFGIVLEPMRRDLGLSVASVMGAFSLAILVSGLTAPLVGRILDRHDPRWLMGGGSLLGALLVAAWSRVDDIVGLYVVFAGMGVAMALVLYEPAVTIISKCFHTQRTRALTRLTLMGAFASFLFSPLTEHLMGAHGWRTAVLVLAIVLGAVTVPLHVVVVRLPPSACPAPTDESEITGRQAVREGRFWLVAGAFAFSSFASVALTVHLVTILATGGLTLRLAATVAGIASLAQIIGRVLFAFLLHTVGAGRAAVASHGLAAVAIGLLAVGEAWAALAFAVIFGACNGLATLLRATLIATHYGTRHYGAVAGRLNAVVLGARSAAPLGAALIALLPGHHHTLLFALALACVAAALLAHAANRTRTQPVVHHAPSRTPVGAHP